MKRMDLFGKNREVTPSFIPHPSFPLFVNFFRKRSLRRLCFYTCLSVILFTGGTSAGTPHPRAGTPPGKYNPQAGTPLGTPHSC